MDLVKTLENYKSYDEYEEADKNAFLYFLKAFGDNAYTRSNLTGHIAVSAWVVNRQKNKVLMAYHNIYDSWAWLGGHADGDKDLLSVAVKEAVEESSIKNIKILSEYPIDISAIGVIPHIKKGKVVPTHIHYNVVYFLEADESENVMAKADENQAVKWIRFEDVLKECKEEHMLPHYSRIIKKMNLL